MGFFTSQAKSLYKLGAITEEEYVIMRSDGRFSKLIVVSAVIMITIYAAIMCQFTYLNIVNGTEVYPPAEFTAGYFAFWTVEIVMLATIKKHNIKNKHEREDATGDILAGVVRRISPGESGKDEPEWNDNIGSHSRTKLSHLPTTASSE